MNYKLEKIGDKEYKFRITNKSQAEIEKRIGPLMGAIEKVTEAEIMATIIWGALYPLNHEVTLDKANDIVDQMVDEGILKGVEKRAEFVMDLLEGAGFLSQENIKEMNEVAEKKKKEATENMKA